MPEAKAYTTRGSVRGDCGHRHRSLAAAVRCFLADHARCSRLGGGAYSDRTVVRFDGSDLDEDEMHEIDYRVENGGCP